MTVHVTGFKKFHGVAENPTEKIVCNLKSFMEKRGLPKGLVLGNCTVLEAAGQSALGPLYEFLESTIADREHGSQNQQVILVRSQPCCILSLYKKSIAKKVHSSSMSELSFINFLLQN